MLGSVGMNILLEIRKLNDTLSEINKSLKSISESLKQPLNVFTKEG